MINIEILYRKMPDSKGPIKAKIDPNIVKEVLDDTSFDGEEYLRIIASRPIPN